MNKLIKCDHCDATIEASPEIIKSGWTKWGIRTDCLGYHCPDCQEFVPFKNQKALAKGEGGV